MSSTECRMDLSRQELKRYQTRQQFARMPWRKPRRSRWVRDAQALCVALFGMTAAAAVGINSTPELRQVAQEQFAALQIKLPSPLRSENPSNAVAMQYAAN